MTETQRVRLATEICLDILKGNKRRQKYTYEEFQEKVLIISQSHSTEVRKDDVDVAIWAVVDMGAARFDFNYNVYPRRESRILNVNPHHKK